MSYSGDESCDYFSWRRVSETMTQTADQLRYMVQGW